MASFRVLRFIGQPPPLLRPGDDTGLECFKTSAASRDVTAIRNKRQANVNDPKDVKTQSDPRTGLPDRACQTE